MRRDAFLARAPSQACPRSCAAVYTIQAAIAELHLHQPRDGESIAGLHERLEDIAHSQVVPMNRAIAVAELQGPQAALILLDGSSSTTIALYHSTRATCWDASAAMMYRTLGCTLLRCGACRTGSLADVASTWIGRHVFGTV